MAVQSRIYGAALSLSLINPTHVSLESASFQQEQPNVVFSENEPRNDFGQIRIGMARIAFAGVAKQGSADSEAQFQASVHTEKSTAEGELVGFLLEIQKQAEVDAYLASIEAQKNKIVENGAVPKRIPTPELLGWIALAGIDDPENSAQIFMLESSGRPDAQNEGGCVGLGQACGSGVKAGLLEACPDFAEQPVCQVQFFDSYAKRRYRTWAEALKKWYQRKIETGHGWW